MSAQVLSMPLARSPLAKLADGSGAGQWFVQRPATPDQWKERAVLMRGSLIDNDWLSAMRPAFGTGGAAVARLEAAAESGVVVTTGQQPRLFGGPLYTWWKALSALALADTLEKRIGMPVAPVFWAATDDSDFAEASSTVVATQDGAERITMAEPRGTGVALAQVPLGDVTEQIRRLEAAAGSASAAMVLDLVRGAYSGDATVGSAYVQLLRSILEPLGVSVLDAAHPAVRTAAHPLLVKSLERAGEIEAMLAERSRALKAAGHAAQVKLVAGRSLAFAESNGKRERIMTRDAVSAATSSAPGTLGPNVLLRPVVERSILPTVAYVGGPAEVAYFAQVTAVAEALDVAAPLVVPRWSGFVVEPRIGRILDRHGLKVEDFSDPHAVETRLARESIPPAVTEALEKLRSSVDKSIADLGSAGGEDLIPNGVLEGLERNVLHRLERLERRIAAGIKSRGTDGIRDAAIARGALFPFGSPQERSLNFVPLLARYGDELVEQLLTEIRAYIARIA